MNEESYKKTVKAAGESRYRAVIDTADKYLSILLGACFALIACVWPFFRGEGFLKDWLKYLLIPAAVFLLATFLRAAIGRKRPYEIWDLGGYFRYRSPAHGSMPSRHAASAFAVCFAVFYFNRIIGIICFVPAALICILRIVKGIQYISDIAAGILLAAAVCIPAFLFI